MSTGLIVFEDQYPLEIVEINGERLFNAHQVGNGLMLGDSAVRKAIGDMDEIDRVMVTNDMITKCSDGNSIHVRTLNNRGEWFLRESGVYEMILRSRKPEAQAFKRWLKQEVLPSIRKTGSYSAEPKELYALPQSYEEALEHLLVAVKGRRIAETKLQEQEPRVRFANTIGKSEDTIDMETMAKVLNWPGMGRNNLIRFLRDHGVIIYDYRNTKPYQKFIDRGWFIVKEKPIIDNLGRTHISVQTRITPKGQSGIMMLFEKHLGPNPNSKANQLTLGVTK